MGAPMPYLPMPSTDAEEYNRNTKDQYAALGRFVEAFESMVDEVRTDCVLILKRDEQHERLLQVAFHHNALSSKPLFEILRALAADFLKQQEPTVQIKTRDTIFGVLSHIASEYVSLANMRNTLLHGTWQVGWVSRDDPNSAQFVVEKYKTTKTGLTKEPVPKDALELLTLADRCNRAANWIALLLACHPFPNSHWQVEELFKFEGQTWLLTFQSTPPETLP
jgi:hypothetical protein